jgi:hypothetical protein
MKWSVLVYERPQKANVQYTAGAKRSYNKIFVAYLRTFARMGFKPMNGHDERKPPNVRSIEALP